jgi:hypothetical protein
MKTYVLDCNKYITVAGLNWIKISSPFDQSNYFANIYYHLTDYLSSSVLLILLTYIFIVISRQRKSIFFHVLKRLFVFYVFFSQPFKIVICTYCLFFVLYSTIDKVQIVCHDSIYNVCVLESYTVFVI